MTPISINWWWAQSKDEIKYFMTDSQSTFMFCVNADFDWDWDCPIIVLGMLRSDQLPCPMISLWLANNWTKRNAHWYDFYRTEKLWSFLYIQYITLSKYICISSTIIQIVERWMWTESALIAMFVVQLLLLLSLLLFGLHRFTLKSLPDDKKEIVIRSKHNMKNIKYSR